MECHLKDGTNETKVQRALHKRCCVWDFCHSCNQAVVTHLHSGCFWPRGVNQGSHPAHGFTAENSGIQATGRSGR